MSTSPNNGKGCLGGVVEWHGVVVLSNTRFKQYRSMYIVLLQQ